MVMAWRRVAVETEKEGGREGRRAVKGDKTQ
jgi:hypothetical protein